MNSQDSRALFEMLESAWIAKGRQPEQITERVVRAWLDTLPDVPLQFVERALQLHARDAQYRHPPTPADVLQIIRERTQAQWPSADEAWSIALQAMDEGATVVWCSEIAQAWNIARPIAEDGDSIGARMAFRESYRRLVRDAQDGGGEPEWEVSLGHNPMLREAPLRQAVQNGLLTQDRIAHLLPAPKPEPGSVAGLISGATTEAQSMGDLLKGLRESLLVEEDPQPDPEKERDMEQKRKAAQSLASREKPE